MVCKELSHLSRWTLPDRLPERFSEQNLAEGRLVIQFLSGNASLMDGFFGISVVLPASMGPGLIIQDKGWGRPVYETGVTMLDLTDNNGDKAGYQIHDTGRADRAALAALGEKPFRAKQIYDWLHVKLAEGFEEMTQPLQGASAEA